MIAIADPALPGLADLGQDALRRITGQPDVALMRFRYRRGKRAILHLATGAGEGSVWFYADGKAKRLARRNIATSRHDPASGALFQPFPHDHRMPQIRDFLDTYAGLAPGLIRGEPLGKPELLRYRPGLSCTFRCPRADGGTVFVKLINDDDPSRLAAMNTQMVSHLGEGPLSVAPIIGTAPQVSAVAYAAAPGRPLDEVLANDTGAGAILQAVDALQRFWRIPTAPERRLTAGALIERGTESVALAAVTVPEARPALERVLARLEDRPPPLPMRPIHADMKLEHLFIDADRTTLIDTESVSLGPPDYDLAQLHGRLWQAELEGRLPHDTATRAASEVRRAAGDAFGWCSQVVALRLAKYYAQRPTPGSADKIAAILDRLA